MPKEIGKNSIKWLFAPLIIVLFMAQIFVPLAVTNAQLELDGNETAVDGNLTLSTNISENTTAKVMDGQPRNKLSAAASTENVSVVVDAFNGSLNDSITKNIEVKEKRELEILFLLQEDTIHRYYLLEAMKNYTLKNTTINLTIYNRDQASENKLTSFDIIALYHLSYTPAVQAKLDEANSTSKTVYLSNYAFLWQVNVPQSIGKQAYKEYWVPSGIENHRRLLTYLAVTLMDVDEEINPGIKLPRSGIFHPDYKSKFQPCKDCLFQNLSSYMEWYIDEGKYHPGNPTVGLTLSSYYYANGYYLDDWIAIIREFENVITMPMDTTSMIGSSS
jgi:cobalamin biosynthesis Mg chelatase CobN